MPDLEISVIAGSGRADPACYGVYLRKRRVPPQNTLKAGSAGGHSSGNNLLPVYFERSEKSFFIPHLHCHSERSQKADLESDITIYFD